MPRVLDPLNIQKAVSHPDNPGGDSIKLYPLNADGMYYKDSSGNTHRLAEDADVFPKFSGEPNGFTDRSQVSLSWNNSTRTLTIAPSDTSFEVWVNGAKFTKTSSEDIQIPAAASSYYIYYDSSAVLQYAASFTPAIITAYAIVAFVYWNGSDPVPDVMSELHGATMSPVIHSYLHRVFGAQFISGMEVSVTEDGDGSLDSHCQVAVTSGSMVDEDIDHTVDQHNLTSTHRIVYREGTEWKISSPTSFLVTTGTNGRANYNLYSGGSWSVQEMTSNKYTVAHLVAFPGLDYTHGSYHVFMGLSGQLTAGDAADAARTELLDILKGGLPWPEIRPVASFVLHTKDGYTNSVKTVIVSFGSGLSYVDLRKEDYR